MNKTQGNVDSHTEDSHTEDSHNKNEWNRFWQGDNVTSFIDRFAEGYDGEVREFWAKHLKDHKSKDKIIDLACGNGAICWLCDDVLNGQDSVNKSKIIGIDFADIKPFEALKRSRINFPEVRFIGNNPIEKLPFNDSEIDIAVSQWGIEYSDFKLTIKELGRVIKDNGKIILVCHVENSTIVEISLQTLIALNLILDKKLHNKLLLLNENINAYGNTHTSLKSKDMQEKFYDVQECVTDILTILEKSSDAGSKHGFEIVTSISAQVNQAIKLKEDSRELISQHKSDLKKTINRLSHLLTACLTKSRLKDLEIALITEGFTLTEIGHINQESGEGKSREMGIIGLAIIAERFDG